MEPVVPWSEEIKNCCYQISFYILVIKVCRMRTWISKSRFLKLMTHFCTSSRIGNKRCLFKFYTSRNVYGHFHIPTQINDLLSYHGKKKVLQTYNFKRICKPFLVLHHTQQHRRSSLQICRNDFRQELHGMNPIHSKRRKQKVQLFIPHGVNVSSRHCLVPSSHQFLEFDVNSRDMS